MFDLDGTLVDSRPGIEASVRAALDGLGIEHKAPIDDAWLGRPLAGLIQAVLPDSGPSERELATDAFMRHYDAIGWRSSEPYEGAASTLERLRRGGVCLFVVTNKRRTPTVAILAHHGFSGFFEAIYTPDSRVPRYASKREMGQACIDEHALTPSSTLVVGDSRDDRELARGCGTLFGAASWGYGNADWDLTEPADAILVALPDLQAFMYARVGGESLP